MYAQDVGKEPQTHELFIIFGRVRGTDLSQNILTTDTRMPWIGKSGTQHLHHLPHPTLSPPSNGAPVARACPGQKC